MLKCLRVSVACTFFLPLSIVSLAVQGWGQQSRPGPIGSPPEAKISLLTAALANGIERPNLTPWHAKISFELTDHRGRPLSHGTFEEYWAGPNKYKRIFATTDFNQVEYRTDAGVRRTGSPDGAPSELTMIVDQFLHPIPLDMDSIDAARLQIEVPAIGETKLVCVTVEMPRSATMPISAIQAGLWRRPNSKETYCTDEHSPVLRFQVTAGGSSRFVRNSITRFQNSYLPQTVEEYEGSAQAQKTLLTAKLETIEAITSVDDAQFTPPANAMLPPKVIALSPRETQSQLLHHSYPQYDYQLPGEQRSVHWSVDVILSLRVHTDGHVSNLRVENPNCPLEQQHASLDAVRNWTYKPFIRNGEPVEVDTQVFLVYPLTP